MPTLRYKYESNCGAEKDAEEKECKKECKRKKGDFNFSPENDIMRIGMLEIQGTTDLV